MAWWDSLETVALLSTTFRWVVAIAGIGALVFGTRVTTLQARATAPRGVNATQRRTFVAAAATLPKGPVTVIPIMGNVESEDYARQLAAVLGEAGYAVAMSGMLPMDRTPTGLRVTVKPGEQYPPHAEGLQAALTQAQIPVVRGHNGLQNDNVLGLVVGVKPQPASR
jgi:hypothetical protein